MNTFKLKKETISTLKFVGILIVIYLFITLIFRFVPPLNKYDLFAIQTDSMEPVISVGDIVITKEIEPESVQIGDIMAFTVDITRDGKDDVVVHYIDEINEFNDQLIFKTKPNVSELQDSWTIEEDDLIGVYKTQINGLGKILLFANSWIGRIIIILDIIIISVVYDILFPKKDNKKELVCEDNETLDTAPKDDMNQDNKKISN